MEAVFARSEDEVLETESSAGAGENVVHRFSFRGGAAEYFRIWAVNVALTALTVGIFSAWAKVRTNRYFYANTFLDGANFEYHARPLSILFARVVVIAVVVGGGYWAELYLPGSFVYTLLLLAFLPWAQVRGLSFNARNSSYRNVRFSFRRGYGLPYLFYILMGTGVGIFALPWLLRGYHSFKGGRHKIGALRFVFYKPSVMPYIFVLWLLPVAAFSLLFAFAHAAYAATGGPDSPVFFLIYPLAAFVFFYGQAVLFLMFWRNIGSENGARIFCDFSAPRFAVLLFVNFFASVLTLGFLHPWAKVRKARFLAERMRVVARSGIFDELFTRHGGDEDAVGEELDASEGFDFDAGLV
ncbi:MAG: YjgN family protein [Gammaproteobacteria bacterium]